MAQQTFNNLSGLFDVRKIINDNANDAEARLSALAPGGVTDSVQVKGPGSNDFAGYVGLKYTEAAGLSVMHLGGTVAGNQGVLLMHSFTNLNFLSNDGNDTLIGRIYNDGNTALRFEGSGTHPLFINNVLLKTNADPTHFLAGDGTYKVAGAGGGTIAEIQVTGGLQVTDPNGPTTIVDGSTIATAASDAQSTADGAVTDAGNAQSTANQAITDAGTAQSTADSKLASVVAGANITVDNTDPQNPVIAATGGGTDERVKVSATDTTPGYLTDKITGSPGVQWYPIGTGGDEDLRLITYAAAVPGYSFQADITDSDPGLSGLKFNNATQNNATFLYISKTSTQFTNGMGAILLGVKAGDRLTIQGIVEYNAKQLIVTGAPIDATGYVKLPITVETAGSDLATGPTSSVSVLLYSQGAAGGGGGGYETIQDAGSPVAQQTTLNFIPGAGISLGVADDAGNNRTNITVTAAGAGASAFDFVIADKQQLSNACTSHTGGVMTLAAGNYLLLGDINLNDNSGPGWQTYDRIVAPNGVNMTGSSGAKLLSNTISSNAVVTGPTSGNFQISDLQFQNQSQGPGILCRSTGLGYDVISGCIFAELNQGSPGVEYEGTGTFVLERCIFTSVDSALKITSNFTAVIVRAITVDGSGMNHFIEVTNTVNSGGRLKISDILMSNSSSNWCLEISGDFETLDISDSLLDCGNSAGAIRSYGGSGVDEVKIRDCRLYGAASIQWDGDSNIMEISGNTCKTNGTSMSVASPTSNNKHIKIIDNTFWVGSPYTCFGGTLTPTTQTHNGGQTTAPNGNSDNMPNMIIMRQNTWRNSGNSSQHMILRESPGQVFGAPQNF